MHPRPDTSRLAVLLLFGLVACAPAPEAKRQGAPITRAERALAQAAWDLPVTHRPPPDPCGAGGTGLDWGPWLDEREQRAQLDDLRARSDATRLVGLTTTLQRERHVVLLSALLDHPSLEVRRAAVQALRNLRDRRGVIALLAAAKHNTFALEPPSTASSSPASAPAVDAGDARRTALEAYRRELGAALLHITRVRPYEGPPQRRGGPARIWTFDFGHLDLWLENEVLRAQRWSE